MRLAFGISLWVPLCSLLSGCAVANILPAPISPTMTEQLLMAQAVELSLEPSDPPNAIPLPPEESICLATTGLTSNQQFMMGVISGWLGKQGFMILQDCGSATYRAQIILQTLGTEQAQSFFGMPAVQVALLPFGLPELPIFKVNYQTGHARFSLEFYENKTGKFVRATPWYRGTTYYNDYTVLFFIEFHRTNLIGGPEQDNPSKTEVSPEEVEEEEL